MELDGFDSYSSPSLKGMTTSIQNDMTILGLSRVESSPGEVPEPDFLNRSNEVQRASVVSLSSW